MEERSFVPAGGCLMALAIVAGVYVGLRFSQPSIGFLAGFGAGLVLLLVVWLIERMHRR